jgi:hypothetical protein
VSEAKRQARSTDPGEEVPKGTAAQGERKAVSSIRASADRAGEEAGALSRSGHKPLRGAKATEPDDPVPGSQPSMPAGEHAAVIYFINV